MYEGFAGTLMLAFMGRHHELHNKLYLLFQQLQREYISDQITWLTANPKTLNNLLKVHDGNSNLYSLMKILTFP